MNKVLDHQQKKDIILEKRTDYKNMQEIDSAILALMKIFYIET